MLVPILMLLTLALCTRGDPCLPQEGVAYRIINRNSNKVIGVFNKSTADGGKIQQFSYSDEDTQKWKFQRYTNSYVIVSQASNKVLDTDATLPYVNGRRIQQWTYNYGGANQRWRVEEATGGFCKILSELNDKAMEVKEQSRVDGADIQAWDYAGGLNQQWKLEVASNQSIECAPGWGLIRKYNFSSIQQAADEWNVITWPAGQVNNEKQSYTTSSNNVFTRNNHLVLKAKREGILPPPVYTSGRVESKHTYSPLETPGLKLRVEFTGKVPTPPGAWPAYWLLGDDATYGAWPATGEIDVMEWAYHWSGIYPATIHWGDDSAHHEQAQRNFTLGASDMANNFITYGVEYSAADNDAYVLYYLRRPDGSTFVASKIDASTWSDFSKCPAGKTFDIFPCSTIAPFDNHMRLVINLAVGGDFGGIGVTDYTAFDDGVEFETSNVVVCEKL